MHKKFFNYFLFITLVGLFFSSCTVTKPYEAPVVVVDSLYRDVVSADTNTIAQLKWNDFFSDAYLKDLIEKGISNNLDLKVAMERITQANAYFDQSGAAFLPTLNANAGVSANHLSDVQNPPVRNVMQYQLGLASGWELDIWGKLKSSKRASFANLLQTEAASRAVQTSIVAGVANYYYLLIALDQQLSITEETVRNWDITVETLKALKEAAKVTEAAVVQSQAQRYAAEVTIPDLKQRIKETENALSILLGLPPAKIVRSTLEDQNVTNDLHAGIPAQLLGYRPDVQQAEYNFRYNFEMTNVARTYFYPSLNITGSAGLSALSIDNLFSGGAFAGSIGAGLLQPILNQRVNKTRLTVAESQQRSALYDFKSTLLNAGREVSDAISSIEFAGQKVSIRKNQLNALEKSVEYSQELLQNGFATYIEIITARQSLLQAELGKVNDKLQQLQSEVNLYRALGGGWKKE
ncbi:MAG: TolC family protein [Ginsengibacter sp.]